MEFRQLAPDTQRSRRRILESILREPWSPDRIYADAPPSSVTRRAIEVLRDRKLDTPEAARSRLKALGRVYDWAIGRDIVSRSLVREVRYPRKKPGGFHTWTPDEVAKFEARHPIGSKARLALALLLYTGQRKSDVVCLGPQHVRDGWLHFTQQKNANTHPVVLELPVLPVLRTIIDETEKTGATTFLVTHHGKPFGRNGFGNKMREWCNQAGLPKCTAHGLRKAGAVIAAENGATASQLMAIFGWRTIKQAELYTKRADQRRLAGDAMRLLQRRPKVVG